MTDRTFRTNMLNLAQQCVVNASNARRDFRRIAYACAVVSACFGSIATVVVLLSGKIYLAAYFLISCIGFAFYGRSSWRLGEHFYLRAMKQREEILEDIKRFSSFR